MRVLVVGVGVSGLAAKRLLDSKGESVYIVENGDSPYPTIVDLVVISPGVQPGSEVIRWANRHGIPVISELELASRYVTYPLVCVTGTNGKSTVTSMIDHLFRSSGKRSIACGNLGLPLSDVVLDYKDLDVAVIEASSFQLGYVRDFRPYVSVWLNFASDHLDYHITIEEYLNAKKRMFENQTEEDWAVINCSELERVGDIKARRLVYSGSNEEVAKTVAGIFGIRGELGDFRPLPHRMQYVATIDGVDFIDDSKATNVHAVNYALSSLRGPIILILGGRDKGDDFKRLNTEKLSCVIVIGEAREKIIAEIKGKVPFIALATLDSAVECAFNSARPGTTVLLSPGCSSFDMFKDYKERGERFQEAVLRLREFCLNEK